MVFDSLLFDSANCATYRKRCQSKTLGSAHSNVLNSCQPRYAA